jgi:pterin-4a-carbinolamine dehydratase
MSLEQNRNQKLKWCVMNKKKYEKKYSNADFYTDGKFIEEVAFKAKVIEFFIFHLSLFLLSAFVL